MVKIVSDEKIVQWKRPEKRIWECNCGCQQFFFHENGDVECCDCNEISQILKCFVKDE